jgi:hypothetical protein
MSGFCTDCGTTVASFEGLTACPACGSTGIPCATDRQVTVDVNWHELHILCVWAENWQRQQTLGRTVYAIAKRLEAQHPEHGPLTLAAELGQLAAQHEVRVNSAELRRDIAEQTGEEVGLA